MYDIIYYEEKGQSKKLGWKGSVDGDELNILPGNRKNAEKKGVILKDFEFHDKKDSVHYPKSGMDQVIAKLMKKNGNAYALPLDKILESKNPEIILRRVALNMRLANKYGFEVILASFAKNESNQRDPSLIRALAEHLGLKEDLAKQSMQKTFK
jgi:hypothetical protein